MFINIFTNIKEDVKLPEVSSILNLREKIASDSKKVKYFGKLDRKSYRV